MCGICGIYNNHGIHQERSIHLIEHMSSLLKHRGPDDEGMSVDPFCALGHRRLSIIDLSKSGHQPFTSDDKRFHLSYNGEIYNYLELKKELEGLGCVFRTKTDTEVLLNAYQQFGEKCLEKFNGMFAFAIYDSLSKQLFLARDRFGVKPLYYTIIDSTLYFASEIKALRILPGMNRAVNNQALFDFLVFNRTDIFDETFHAHIFRIPKGHYAVFTDNRIKITEWWNAEKYAQHPCLDAPKQITKKIEELLISSINLRLRSDVAVGSCLSGGLDSSIITGILSEHFQVNTNFSTFTAYFPGHACDEKRHVDALLQRFPVKNFGAYPSGETLHKNLTEFVSCQEEPVTTPSPYAQYEVMKLAHEHRIPVLLDGQGGDENFAGYQYFHGYYLLGLLRKKHITSFIREFLKTIFRRQDALAWKIFIFQNLPLKAKKSLVQHSAPYITNDFFNTHFHKSRILNDYFNAYDLNTSLVRDFQYKLEHLLKMEDRNSMAFSIETRLPYLDYRLVEYVLSISENLKIKSGETKYLQKKALGQYTATDILDRKDKIGFETPTNAWLNEPSWQTETKKAIQHCEENLSNVFKKNVISKTPGDKNKTRWKIIHLAKWQELTH
jgi:asparagine synthase (glutamine-hydrolysing)